MNTYQVVVIGTDGSIRSYDSPLITLEAITALAKQLLTLDSVAAVAVLEDSIPAAKGVH